MRIPILFAFFILVLFPSPTRAEQKPPAEWFQALPKEELETAVIRLEYLGPQHESIPALVITVAGHDINWNAFHSVPGVQIGDYEVKWRQSKPTFTVAERDMQNFLGSIIPLIKEPETGGIPWLSLTVVVGSDTPFKSFHRIFTQRQANDLFVYMRVAFRADPKDISIIN